MNDRASAAPLAVVVLAAGQGLRMKSETPKVLHPLAGRPMIGQVLDTVGALSPTRIVVVVGAGAERVAEAVAPHPTVVQEPRRGTGHAVLQARDALDGFTGDILVLYGDTPLIHADTLAAMIAARHGPGDPAVVLLGFRPADPAHYGRVVLGEGGRVRGIVEYADASEAERNITLCNAGILLGAGPALFSLINRLGQDNAKGEYYLTEIFALADADGRKTAMAEADPQEVLGVNSRAELAVVETVMQTRLRARAMVQGVTFVDPTTVWLSVDTSFGQDVTVQPNVFFGPGVSVGDGVEIRAFSHLEGARIETGATVGPFARLRPGTVVGPSARVGNFVEVKNAVLGKGAKVNHLAYVGDAQVGAEANIGAGTITCNYDGIAKHRTEIGKGAFIGSNTALVAPVKVGDGAVVGAGSTITRDVAPDAVAVARGEQTERPGAAKRLMGRAGKSKGKG